jgi:hemoglobin
MKQQTPYQQLGGEVGLRELVDRFYANMDALSEARTIRSLHARDLRVSREKLFLFLSGWLGGPDLYVQKYGHPRLRARHLPFSIGIQERDQWMLCMRKALSEMTIPEDVKSSLEAAFWKTADFMRNRPEHDTDAQLPLASGNHG